MQQRSSEAVFEPKGLEDNDEQEAVQMSSHPLVLVEANAGAAKTTTLARRIGQALAGGTPPTSILALTYSAPACVALHRALQSIGIDAVTRKKLRILTFEDLARKSLRKIEGSDVPQLDTPEEVKPILMLAIDRVVRNLEERHPEELYVPGSGDAVIEQYLKDFLHLKGTMQLTLEAADRTFTPGLAMELGRDYTTLRVFRSYEAERRGGHPDRPRFRYEADSTYDLAKFLLGEDVGLFSTHPLDLGLRLIAVDEMHDMNRAMFTVLQGLLLANRRAQFIGVGDRDQVIHAVAGADPRFMGECFEQEIGLAKRYPLTGSYRFGSALARAAGRVAGKPYRSLSARKTKVVVEGTPSGAAEERILDVIRNRAGLESRSPSSQLAILIRHPHQSIALENTLLQADVPYRVVGFDSYLLRPEVLLLRALLAYARDDYSSIQNPETRERLLDAMLLFACARIDTKDQLADDRAGVRKDALAAIAESPRMIKPFLENHVLRTGAADAVQRIRLALEAVQKGGPGFLQRVVEALDVQHLAAKTLVESRHVQQVTQNMSALLSSAAAAESPEAFFTQLNAFEMRLADLQTKECVVLSSIEAVKGLEFDHVVLPNMTAGQFAIAGNSADDRNLFYVAITRAKNQLTIYCDPRRPSRFLADAGLTVAEAQLD